MDENVTVGSFRTFDLALAATLVVAGFPIESLDRSTPPKVAFLFEGSMDLEATTKAYWADQLRQNPRMYFDTLKHLKSRIYSGQS